jgi:AcrR family transcriptional regulator
MRRRRTPADDTRDRILTSARSLFATRPDALAGEVARAAGVSRATLHRHFRSREDLLRAADIEPEPGARERALAAGIELLARDGLAALSMDELAEQAGVSRANLYRLFPGKSALFRELVRVYSPLEPVGATVTELMDQPPEVVMPAVARAAARHLEGRVGLVRSLIFEVSAPSSEAEGARELAMEQALGPLAAYLLSQMQAGNLRPMHPLLAVQAFAGPIVFHLVLRPFAESLLGFDMPVEEAADQLARTWVAGMRPDREVKKG